MNFEKHWSKKRSQDFRRHQRRRHIAKRRRIMEKIWGNHDTSNWRGYHNGSIYDKGKVHCSCEACAYSLDKDERYQSRKKEDLKIIKNYK